MIFTIARDIIHYSSHLVTRIIIYKKQSNYPFKIPTKFGIFWITGSENLSNSPTNSTTKVHEKKTFDYHLDLGPQSMRTWDLFFILFHVD